MYSRILSASLYGLSGEKTWAEVDAGRGMPVFSVVGLANRSVREAKDRIHSALINCGFSFKPGRVTVNLSPANRKKDGSHYDLAIALGYLFSSEQIKAEPPGEEMAFIGELSLDGRVCGVEGVLPMLTGLQRGGVKTVMLPGRNLEEARLVKGLFLVPVDSLSQAADWFEGFGGPKPVKADGGAPMDAERCELPDFSDIKGQEMVKRAAQVAAAGMHGLLMIGHPGVGKSMVGKRIPGILPPLGYDEQLDVTQVYSAAGQLRNGDSMIRSRPYRAPHHSISHTALIGGGSRPKPGEISLAHTGVLFLDELAEFSAHTLDMLRQPMEDGFVSIDRTYGKFVYPADFMLVAATNPCRCGYYGDPVKQCSCSETDRRRYMSRISGPLLDRIDLHVVMERPVYQDMDIASRQRSTGSKELREGVLRAREIQSERYKELGISCNSQLGAGQVAQYCALGGACEELMRTAFSALGLSARAYHRVLRTARTIADIEGCPDIAERHLTEALSYRLPEKYFG
ncbi:MAG: YifB family Mg chelatase-like AAA ATPase [Firmicutes bacterium]|nr:YifB family Mg chelatase-like AAA ATPase [Bacillota bacterium]